jgi:ribosomal protein S27E
MKIIKSGIPPHTRTSPNVTCDHCGCIFQFEAWEGERHDDQRDGSYYKIGCPECRRRNIVAERFFK